MSDFWCIYVLRRISKTSKNPNSVVQAQKKQSDRACRKKDHMALNFHQGLSVYQTNVATLFLFY